jgi:hypothetical protein
MKLFYPIALALVPVLATAAIVFVSYENNEIKFVWPVKSGLVAFGVVLLGAILQIGKEVKDWRDDKAKETAALAIQNAKDKAAINGLERVCDVVNFMLQWISSGSKVRYPCQQDEIPNWFYAHNMYRSELIYYWTRRQASRLDEIPQNEWKYPFDILASWRDQLDKAVATLDRENETVMSAAIQIQNIKRQIDSNWGLVYLSEVDKSNPHRIFEAVGKAMQEVVNSAEFMYPILVKSEYLEGRLRCADLQAEQFPDYGPADLIFYQ